MASAQEPVSIRNYGMDDGDDVHNHSRRYKKKHWLRANIGTEDDHDGTALKRKNKRRRVLEDRSNDIISAGEAGETGITKTRTRLLNDANDDNILLNHHTHRQQRQQEEEVTVPIERTSSAQKQERKMKDTYSNDREVAAFIAIQRQRLRIQLAALSMMIYHRQARRVQRRVPTVPGHKIALIYMDFFLQLEQKGFSVTASTSSSKTCLNLSSSMTTTERATNTTSENYVPRNQMSSTTLHQGTVQTAATSSTTSPVSTARFHKNCECACLQPPPMNPNYKKTMKMDQGANSKQPNHYYYKGINAPSA